MKERTATVHYDEQGRMYIPKAVREALDIVGESGTAEIVVRIED